MSSKVKMPREERLSRFAVSNRHGLRFTIYAKDRQSACARICMMLGKRSVPEHIQVAPY